MAMGWLETEWSEVQTRKAGRAANSTDSPESIDKTAMRNVALQKFQAPSASDQAGCENETVVTDDSPTATGSSQSLHSSDDRREPNPLRAKGGRKVECENVQNDET